jgi:hypothetical protein
MIMYALDWAKRTDRVGILTHNFQMIYLLRI